MTLKLMVVFESLRCVLSLFQAIDCSPPGSSVHGIFQARVLEWGAITFSVVAAENLYYLLYQSNSFVRHISYVCGGMLDRRIGSDTCYIHRANVRGKKLSHSGCVSWS